ncbi:MAG TPA: hypothetical protein PLL50_04580, partial [Propionicimonas sp.]|nr:hypothetical protein [Propionicimonas sp.]
MFRNLKDAVAIARSEIVDREYYEALTGHRFQTTLAAAQDFLAAPERADRSLHPLFEPSFLDSKPDPDLVLHYLRQPTDYLAKSPHPCFDLKAAKKALRAAGVAAPDGAWLAWTRTATPETLVPVPAGATPVRWGELRAALIRAAQQWRAGAAFPCFDWAAAAQRPRNAGRTSIIVPIVGSLNASLRRLSLLMGDDERELVCTGFTSRAQFSSFSALAQVRPLVLVPGAGRNLAQQWNAGAAASSGDRLVFLAPHATLPTEAIPELLAALANPEVAVAQPLNETPAMLVHSAGAYFADGDALPSALL